jgi:hypothetical protein
MIKPTAMVFTSMLTELSMKESGRMTCNTEKELRLGLMAVDTRETMPSVGNTASVHISGTMALSILVTGMKTRLAA